MPHSYQAAFIERIPGLDDDALLETLVRVTTTPDQYTAEAIAAVSNEIARRRLTPEQVREAEARFRHRALEALREDALSLALEGRTVGEIKDRLQRLGVRDEDADALANGAWNMPLERRKSAGRRNMLSGAALCTLGLAITGISCLLAATTPGGGRYLIAWGLVLFGVMQFVRGLDQWMRRS